MICKNLKTDKYFNYKFTKSVGLIELDDTKNPKLYIHYTDWCKDYLIIDKWRDLDKYDIKYNEEIDKKIDNGKFSSS